MRIIEGLNGSFWKKKLGTTCGFSRDETRIFEEYKKKNYQMRIIEGLNENFWLKKLFSDDMWILKRWNENFLRNKWEFLKKKSFLKTKLGFLKNETRIPYVLYKKENFLRMKLGFLKD